MPIDRSIRGVVTQANTQFYPQYRGEWQPLAYEIADLVRYGNTLYVAENGTTNTDIPGSSSKWKVVVSDGGLRNDIVDALTAVDTKLEEATDVIADVITQRDDYNTVQKPAIEQALTNTTQQQATVTQALTDLAADRVLLQAELNTNATARRISTTVGEVVPVLENIWESAAADGAAINTQVGTAFAGFGFFLGNRDAFDRIEFTVLPRTAITKIRIVFRNGSKSGAILHDQTFDVAPLLDTQTNLIFDLNKPVGDGATPIYLEWHANGKTGYFFASNTLFPSPPNPPAGYWYNTDLGLGLYDAAGGQVSYTQRVRLSLRNYDAGFVGPTKSWLTLMDTAMSNPTSLLPRFGQLEPVMATVVGEVLTLDTAYDNFTGAANNNYGFAFPVGPKQNFDLVEFMIVPHQQIKIPTFVKVRIRENDSAGAILGEVRVPISPRLNTRKTVRAKFPSLITNTAAVPLWLEFTADGYIGYVGQYGTLNQPYPTPLGKYVNVFLTSPDQANGVAYPTSVYPSQGTLWVRFGVASASLKQFAPTGELSSAIQGMFDQQAYWRPVLNLQTLYAVEGVPCEMFFQNIIRGPGDYTDYTFDIYSPSFTQVDANVHYGNRHWSWTPTAAQATSDKTLTLTVRRDGIALVTASLLIRVSALSRGVATLRKILCIGDSLTDHGRYMARFLWRIQQAGDPLDVVSLGTRLAGAPWTTGSGLPEVRTEGWSGKTVAFHYSDPASNFTFDAAGNADGTIFNFARYLEVNSFTMSSDDLVYFALGTNDIGAPGSDQLTRHIVNQMFVQLDAMITNIRAAVPNINIGIVQIIPAANVMWQRQRNRARAIYVEMINAKYGNREGEKIYVIPMGHALDCDNAYPWNNRILSPWTTQTTKFVTDTIHPVPQTTPVSDNGGYGYDQMGDALYGFAKWLWRA